MTLMALRTLWGSHCGGSSCAVLGAEELKRIHHRRAPPLRHTPGLPVMLLGSRQGEREDQLPGSPSSDPQAQGLGSKPWMAEP